MHLRALLGTLLVLTLLAPGPVAGFALRSGDGSQARAASTEDGAPLRVTFVGDSMTQGQSGSTTWRYWLWREFGDQRVAATFVGPQTGLSKGGGANLYNHTDHGFQKFHAAQAGTRFAYHLGRVRQLVESQAPDVVVLQLGFNDAAVHDAARIAADTGLYLERLFEADPDVRVVLGEIPPGARPFVTQPQTRNARTALANRMVAEEWGDDERVAIAHTRTTTWQPWSPARHTFDGAHPNATGETLMAHRMALALAELGVFARPVDVYRPTTWTPAARPTVTVKRRAATVRVGVVRRVVSATSARVVVANAAGRRVWRSGWTKRATVRTTLRPGRYRVWLEVRRQTMAGATWSTPVRVRR
ncbi:SGNH/GDSL hydrolase family protein [Nocardioides pantholopis]|uniref:SGNH/GDSL hydrolase family protein n=1 Tax=Nocardioides pantholopis TaxID=2483798 RepID=UPI000FDBD93D|nr:GDSL-type esterase/lipase family protein [Nocardioides pantholopis]